MAAAAPAANVSEMTQKRHREDLPIYGDSYGSGDEDDQNPQKRSRHGFLSRFLCSDDAEDLATVQGELVFDVMKDLKQEISKSSEVSITNGYNQIEGHSKSADKDYEVEVEETVGSTSSYEYLLSATDDELGIPPSPPVPLDENDGPNISQKFWNDLFEYSSTEPSATAENMGTLQPCSSHCYSGNYRDYGVYSGVVAEWTEEAFTDWSLDGHDSVLMSCTCI